MGVNIKPGQLGVTPATKRLTNKAFDIEVNPLNIELPDLKDYNMPAPVIYNSDAGETWDSVQARKAVEDRYNADVAAVRKKQADALAYYSKLSRNDLNKYFDTLEKDLASGKIRQDYFDQVTTKGTYANNYKQRVELREKKAQQEAALAKQRAEAEAARRREQALANQRNASENLQVDDESGGKASVVTGTQTTGLEGESADYESGRKRRSKRQLTSYLGV